MPASFGLECPHLHCIRVHNKGLQMPTPPCARAQPKTRASKRCPRRPPCVRPKGARVGLIRAWKDTRAAPLCVHTKMQAPPPYARLRHTRVGLLLHAPKMVAPTWTRAKVRASPPATCVAKMRASEQLQGS